MLVITAGTQDTPATVVTTPVGAAADKTAPHTRRHAAVTAMTRSSVKWH
jgi:hypothetical protein